MLHLPQQHIIHQLGNDIADLDKVLLHFAPITIKRGEQLLRQREVCRYVYFVATGCLQMYGYDADGNETTRDIVIENNWCADLISFGSQQPATENIRAVEPSQLCRISHPAFQELLQTVLPFDKAYRQILETSYANSVYRLNTFVSMTALERVKWLMEYRPTLMTRLSSKLLASYLGISQETFSRLKGRL